MALNVADYQGRRSSALPCYMRRGQPQRAAPFRHPSTLVRRSSWDTHSSPQT